METLGRVRPNSPGAPPAGAAGAPTRLLAPSRVRCSPPAETYLPGAIRAHREAVYFITHRKMSSMMKIAKLMKCDVKQSLQGTRVRKSNEYVRYAPKATVARLASR